MGDGVNSRTSEHNSLAAPEKRTKISATSVLDHGFVRLIDTMGSDQAIVDSARVSYGEGTRMVRRDRQLIRYLLRNHHTSPFEMCELKFHISMPIFVARQWIRHRTANVNEVSARYSILPDRFYIPRPEHLQPQDTKNRQGRADTPLPLHLAQRYRDCIAKHCAESYATYKKLLGDGDDPGLAREVARIVLPANVYTEWYWKIDLHNLLHFLALRLHPHAQYEIRAYAEIIAGIVRKNFPLTWEAFQDYVVHARHFSRPQLDSLLSSFGKEEPFFGSAPSSMTAREWRELQETFGVAEKT